ncbi:MAG: hypothetical protein QM674_24360 [Burkholderiaceae bacterium]
MNDDDDDDRDHFHDYLLQPLPRLTGEAATVIVDFLYGLIEDLESTYYVEFTDFANKRDAERHAREMSPIEPWRKRRPDEPR